MKPEFHLVLDGEPSDDLANAAYEAGFDDCLFTVRGDRAAIEVFDREGTLLQVVDTAIRQAEQHGLNVVHVELPRESFSMLAPAEN